MHSRNEFDIKMARIVEAVGAKNDTALAKSLGISPASVAGVRQRQLIPGNWIEKIARDYSVNANWLFFGTGTMRSAEADSQGQNTAQAPPAGEPPRAQGDEGRQITIPQEEFLQMVKIERALRIEVGDLKANVVRLEGRIAAQEQTLQYMREQLLRDARDSYELQEADVGPGSASALNAPLKGSTSE